MFQYACLLIKTTVCPMFHGEGRGVAGSRWANMRDEPFDREAVRAPDGAARPLRVLLLEDDERDAALILHELRRAGIDPEWRRVAEESDYLGALDSGLDVILANFRMPRYDALRALAALREREIDVPFLIVSGTSGEETAVTAMKAGAADYLLKDGLSRLGQAVGRALEQRKQAARCRAAENALRASEERFRRTAHAVTDLIMEWDIAADRLEYFGAAAAKLGYREEELPRTCASWIALIHPEDRSRVLAEVDALMAGAPVRVEYRLLKPDGTMRHLVTHSQVIPCSCDAPRKVLTAITDVTEHVETQQRIASMNQELRELSARLMRAQDEERRRFARELHDSTAQGLTALSLALNLTGDLPGLEAVPEAQRTLAECAAMVEASIREVRTMSYVLHPLLLDDAGLEAALRSFVNGFQKRTKIEVSFYAAVDRGRREDAVETAAFRFIQEALSNVHRHSGATRVEVRVVESERQLSLQVCDNGRGFPPDALSPSGALLSSGVGIAGMRERARFLGGGLTIRSSSEGSTLEFKIPTHEQD